MNVKIGNEKIKISKNKNNRFRNPLGLFPSSSKIEIYGNWYSCSIDCIKKEKGYYIQIFGPIVDEKKSIVEEFDFRTLKIPEIYKDIKVTKIKYAFIKYLLNIHRLNHLSFNIREAIYKRRVTVNVFLIALFLSAIYYIINNTTNGSLLGYIAENNLIQSVIIFLTISSFINIFTPFTLKKEIDKDDIEKISKETFEEIEENKEIEENASF